MHDTDSDTSATIHTTRRRCGLVCPRTRRGGFSITELLVVVGIIVLLASLLMVAMGRVRLAAKTSQTQSTMQGFAAACEAFQIEHGSYPGVIPERVLASEVAIMENNTLGDVEGPITFSGIENAILHLMGGYRLWSPGTAENSPTDIEYEQYDFDYELYFGTGNQQWRLKIRLADMGQGPFIKGKSYAPYYTPAASELMSIVGQIGQSDPSIDSDDHVRIPELVDAWGQPIMYIRQIRTDGPLVGEVGGDERTQFLFGPDGDTNLMFGSLTGYLRSTNLGELSQNQVDMSILNNASDRLSTFAQIIRHPAFGDPEEPLDDNNAPNTAARGSFVLMSAGPDGVYFSIDDGPGRPSDPVTNIVSGDDATPQVIDEYDDVLHFGGG